MKFSFLGLESDYGISLLSFLLLCSPVFFRILWDWYTQKILNKEVNHTLHTIGTLGYMTAVCVIVLFLEPVYSFFQPLGLSIGIFGTLFDYLRNLSVGENIFYVDQETDGKGSITDRIYQRLPWFGILFLKAVALLTSFSFYFFWTSIKHYPY